MTDNGKVVGRVDLYYDTQIEGGRPVFVGDVTIGAEFYVMMNQPKATGMENE